MGALHNVPQLRQGDLPLANDLIGGRLVLKNSNARFGDSMARRVYSRGIASRATKCARMPQSNGIPGKRVVIFRGFAQSGDAGFPQAAFVIEYSIALHRIFRSKQIYFSAVDIRYLIRSFFSIIIQY